MPCNPHHGQAVIQEVFLGAYKAMPGFRQQGSIRTWLFAIARKQRLKALRKSYRWRQLSIEQSVRQCRSTVISLEDLPPLQ